MKVLFTVRSDPHRFLLPWMANMDGYKVVQGVVKRLCNDIVKVVGNRLYKAVQRL